MMRHRAQQDTFNGARGVECPFCHQIVTVYDKHHAATVKIVGCGCVECLCKLGEDGWTITRNPSCPIHGKKSYTPEREE